MHSALAAIPHLRVTQGAFIAVGSIACDLPSPILSAYAASKHAVKGFVNSLRMEMFNDRIPVTITLIKPAGIDTPIAERAANHMPGKAMIPQPIYDPALVAQAILHAAQHVSRDITVGGLGRLQVLLGTGFPAILDRLSPVLAAMTLDRTQAATREHSVFAPVQPGRERGGIQFARKTSIYTASRRHPLVTGACVATTALMLARAVVRKRLV